LSYAVFLPVSRHVSSGDVENAVLPSFSASCVQWFCRMGYVVAGLLFWDLLLQAPIHH
jgi:hypothetical protein